MLYAFTNTIYDVPFCNPEIRNLLLEKSVARTNDNWFVDSLSEYTNRVKEDISIVDSGTVTSRMENVRLPIVETDTLLKT